MSNAIKYNTSAETLALKKGNFWIGTGDVGKGPTSSTGFYNGITPPSGGYTIYLNKESGGPSIYTVSTVAELTGLTSTIAGQTLTTSGACLNYFATQTDKMIFNIDYPPIVTSGLILSYDAGFTPSYPTTGTTWYDMGPSGKTQTLYNGPTYSNGSIVFDGVDDYTSIPSINGPSLQTIEIFFNANSTSNKNLLSGNQLYRPRISLRNNIINVYYGMETGTGDIIFTFNSITTSQFYQLVYTYSGSTNHKCYLNTVEGTRTSNGSAINGIPNFTSLDLCNNAGSEGNFNGKISVFRLYDRVLTSDEIQQNYEAVGQRYTSFSVQYLVIGGGGGPGMGGGGAGGYLESTTTSLTTQTNYTITVGGGGPGFASGASGIGTKGSDSVFSTITATGGGYGGNGGASSGPGGPGGSGGGGGGYSGGQGGAGNTPSTSPSQGNNGGNGNNVAPQGSGWLGGGGGGAGGVGGNFVSTTSGNGGSGTSSSITGSAVSRAGGGAGGGNSGLRGTATSGGGNANTSGTVNTGGGGGGRDWGNPGGAGGSGIVILKIPDVYNANFSSGVSFTKSTSVSGYKIYTITATSTTSETVSFL
jgi:hypothetical protein